MLTGIIFFHILRKIIRASNLESIPRLRCSASLQDLRGKNSFSEQDRIFWTPPANRKIYNFTNRDCDLSKNARSKSVSNLGSNLFTNLPWELDLDGSLDNLDKLLSKFDNSKLNHELLNDGILCDTCRLNNMKDARNNIANVVDRRSPVSKISQLGTIQEANNCDKKTDVKRNSSAIANELREIRDLIKSNASIVSTIKGLTGNQNTNSTTVINNNNANKSDRYFNPHTLYTAIDSHNHKSTEANRLCKFTKEFDVSSSSDNQYCLLQDEVSNVKLVDTTNTTNNCRQLGDDSSPFPSLNTPITTLL